jgi:hypothetical protein
VVWEAPSRPYLTKKETPGPSAHEARAALGQQRRRAGSRPGSIGMEIGPITAATMPTMIPSTPPKRSAWMATIMNRAMKTTVTTRAASSPVCVAWAEARSGLLSPEGAMWAVGCAPRVLWAASSISA